MSDNQKRTILVVEDFPDSRALLCSLLRTKGYKVIEANDGMEGISQATRNKPDLILMDLAMPVLDGLEAARRMKQSPELAGIPIFVISAYATDEVKADALAAGCEEVFSKPLNLQALLDKIKFQLAA